jgi:hypothetical protein
MIPIHREENMVFRAEAWGPMVCMCRSLEGSGGGGVGTARGSGIDTREGLGSDLSGRTTCPRPGD